MLAESRLRGKQTLLQHSKMDAYDKWSKLASAQPYGYPSQLRRRCCMQQISRIKNSPVHIHSPEDDEPAHRCDAQQCHPSAEADGLCTQQKQVDSR